MITITPSLNTRGHNLKLYKGRSRLEVRKNSFRQRTVEKWNDLPSSESRLDRYWENQERKYDFYKHEITTTEHGQSKTRIDKELTIEDTTGDLQSEEDLR